MDEVAAALTIQRVGRGHLARRAFAHTLNWHVFNVLDNDEENVGA
jgi:hypothetical protein